MSRPNSFPGHCADCGRYVATRAGVYVRDSIRVYCAAHAPGAPGDRLTAGSRACPAVNGTATRAATLTRSRG